MKELKGGIVNSSTISKYRSLILTVIAISLAAIGEARGTGDSGLIPTGLEPRSTAQPQHLAKAEQQIMNSDSEGRAVIRLKQAKTILPSVTSVAWSPDGKLLATASGDDMRVNVWDARSLALVKELSQGAKGHGGPSNFTAFSPNGRYLASGLSTVNVWNTATWNLQTDLIAPHVKPGVPQDVGLRSVAFSPDSGLLVAAYSGEKQIIVAFHVPGGGIAWAFEPQPSIGKPLITTGIVFTPDGNSVVFGTGEGRPGPYADLERLSKIVVLDARTGRLRNHIDGIHVDHPTALALSIDGKWVATGTSTGTREERLNLKSHRVSFIDNRDPIRVWALDTGKPLVELPVQSAVWALAFSRDKRYVISSRSDIREHMTIGVWDLSSGRLVQEIKTPPAAGTPFALEFSPDGSQLAAAGGNQLLLFDVVVGW